MKKLDCKEAENYELKQLISSKETELSEVTENLDQANELI